MLQKKVPTIFVINSEDRCVRRSTWWRYFMIERRIFFFLILNLWSFIGVLNHFPCLPLSSLYAVLIPLTPFWCCVVCWTFTLVWQKKILIQHWFILKIIFRSNTTSILWIMIFKIFQLYIHTYICVYICVCVPVSYSF